MEGLEVGTWFTLAVNLDPCYVISAIALAPWRGHTDFKHHNVLEKLHMPSSHVKHLSVGYKLKHNHGILNVRFLNKHTPLQIPKQYLYLLRQSAGRARVTRSAESSHFFRRSSLSSSLPGWVYTLRRTKFVFKHAWEMIQADEHVASGCMKLMEPAMSSLPRPWRLAGRSR